MTQNTQITVTLKELLDRCDFKDIALCIAEWYPEEAVNMSHFKEAFDCLRQLEPIHNTEYESGQKITVSKENFEEDEKKFNKPKQDYYISVHPCGDNWESSLAKEIVVPEELKLTDKEIAAHCLWEMTFYGNPHNKEEFDEVCLRLRGKTDKSNPYTVAAEKLEDKLRKNYLPKRYKYATHYANFQEFLKGKNGRSTPFFKYIPERFGCREPRKNRPKRMRDNRLEQRIKQLERMAKPFWDCYFKLMQRAKIKGVFNAENNSDDARIQEITEAWFILDPVMMMALLSHQMKTNSDIKTFRCGKGLEQRKKEFYSQFQTTDEIRERGLSKRCQLIIYSDLLFDMWECGNIAFYGNIPENEIRIFNNELRIYKAHRYFDGSKELWNEVKDMNINEELQKILNKYSQ